VSCAKTTEPIDLSFWLWTMVDRRKQKFNPIRYVANRIFCVVAVCVTRGRSLSLSVCLSFYIRRVCLISGLYNRTRLTFDLAL